MNATIVKKGKNYYIAIEYYENGHRRTRSISPRKELGLNRPAEHREVKALLHKIMEEHRKGIYIKPSEATVKSYAELWLEDYARPGISQKTYDTYSNAIHNHIIPGIGHLAIGSLKPSQLKGFYAKKKKPGGRADGKEGLLSNRSIEIIHQVIKLILNSAAEDELVSRNIAEQVKPPRAEKPKIRYWEWEDAKRFLAYEKRKYEQVQGQHYPVYLLALTTGKRRGDILALSKKYFSAKNKEITVAQSLVETDSGPLLQGAVKTDNSYRKLDISDNVVNVLKAHIQKHSERFMAFGRPYDKENNLELIYLTTTLNPVSPSNMDKHFRESVKRYNKQAAKNNEPSLPHIGGLHSLRHTYATRLLELGYDMRYVQERLGHKSIVVTLNTYSHVSPKKNKEIATLTDDLF